MNATKKVHEWNGCVVGPGLYQEWTYFIHAAREPGEQNLELCRSASNNSMLFYRVLRPISKGRPLLAWYDAQLESEISQSLLNRYQILPHQRHHHHQQQQHLRLDGKSLFLLIFV